MRALAGKRVAVIGGGSSAMDCAATALEEGAAGVDLLIRRADIPRVNKSKGANNPGFDLGHHDLPDDWKWRLRHYINVQQVPPPRGSTLRVSRFPNARFNLGCAILDIRQASDTLRIHTARGDFDADFLIASTGFRDRLVGAARICCAGAARARCGATASRRLPARRTRNSRIRPTWAGSSSSRRRRRAVARGSRASTASAIRRR